MNEFIYCVSSSLFPTGWKTRVEECPYTEGPKIYSVNGGKKKIKKGDLLKPDTMYVRRAGFYNYFTWCFKDDIGLAKDILKDTIMAAHEKNVEEMKALTSHIEAGAVDEPMREWKALST